MNVGILHLSDIHFRSSNNPIEQRTAHIANAFLSRISESTIPLIAVTGDIAFSGRSDEYLVAETFIKSLSRTIGERRDSSAIPIIMVPGNHDCDFQNERQVRQLLLERFNNISSVTNMTDASVFEELTQIQKNYFALMNAISPRKEADDHFENIAWTNRLSFRDISIIFSCYNTAWVSRKKELQGQLVFPIDAVSDTKALPDLVISLFHHPYNWQQQAVGRALRNAIENSSDVILTGHEHDPDAYARVGMKGYSAHYVDGDLLQNVDSLQSGFNVVLIDIAEKAWRTTHFLWRMDESLYQPEDDSPWQSFGRSKRTKQQFVNTPHFAELLSDPGATFTHPRVRNLTLKQLFVYPDIMSQIPTKHGHDPVAGSNLKELIMKERCCVLVGAARSGKTALSKILYTDLLEAGRVSLWISGPTLKRRHVDSIDEAIRTAVTEQYGEEFVERFSQLEPRARAIVIDDFHRVKITSNRRSALIQKVMELFSSVVLLVDEEFEIDTVLSNDAVTFTSSEIATFHIRPLGHLKRNQLIKRWCTLGDELMEEDADEAAIAYRVLDIERTITTLLGRGLLPSYPIFVLTILQILESGKNPNTVLGSYGYIYETLIATGWLKRALTHWTQSLPIWVS